MFSDEEFVAHNKRGIIPAPGEGVEAFEARVHQATERTLAASLWGFDEEERAPKEELEAALLETGELYDVRPDWVSAFYSSRGLAWWHGGGMLLLEEKGGSPPLVSLQLRAHFKKNRRHLGLYDRHEILVHELLHCGRSSFEEPHFEEFLAYQSSRRAYRRFLGPLFPSTVGFWWFFGSLLGVQLFDHWLVQGEHWTLWSWGWPLRILPFFLIGTGCYRMWKRRRQFKRALHTLKGAVQSLKKARAILYRLTDDEIIRFSRTSSEEFLAEAKERAAEELRWKVICLSYLG